MALPAVTGILSSTWSIISSGITWIVGYMPSASGFVGFMQTAVPAAHSTGKVAEIAIKKLSGQQLTKGDYVEGVIAIVGVGGMVCSGGVKLLTSGTNHAAKKIATQALMVGRVAGTTSMCIEIIKKWTAEDITFVKGLLCIAHVTVGVTSMGLNPYTQAMSSALGIDLENVAVAVSLYEKGETSELVHRIWNYFGRLSSSTCPSTDAATQRGGSSGGGRSSQQASGTSQNSGTSHRLQSRTTASSTAHVDGGGSGNQPSGINSIVLQLIHQQQADIENKIRPLPDADLVARDLEIYIPEYLQTDFPLLQHKRCAFSNKCIRWVCAIRGRPGIYDKATILEEIEKGAAGEMAGVSIDDILYATPENEEFNAAGIPSEDVNIIFKLSLIQPQINLAVAKTLGAIKGVKEKLRRNQGVTSFGSTATSAPRAATARGAGGV